MAYSPNRRERIAFYRPALGNGNQAVDIAGGKGHDSAIAEHAAHDARKVAVHRPGRGHIVGRTEFLAGHRDDIRHVRKARDFFVVQKVAANRFDSVSVEVGFAAAGKS